MDFCKVAWKETFANKVSALKAARNGMRVYRCPDCMLWHLTGHSERQKRQHYRQARTEYV